MFVRARVYASTWVGACVRERESESESVFMFFFAKERDWHTNFAACSTLTTVVVKHASAHTRAH